MNKEDEKLPLPASNATTRVGGPVASSGPSEAHVSLPPAPLASVFSVKEGMDLTGESEDYTTAADGSRLERVLEELGEKEMIRDIDKMLEDKIAADEIMLKALKPARVEYAEYLAVTEERNIAIAKRKRIALRVLVIAGALAAALTVALAILGGL